MPDSKPADVIVIGGGPGGATAAMLLAQKGHRVVLFEREKFPRFQIGESLLPYNNDLFRKLGVWDEVSRAGFLPKYGAEFLTADGAVSYTFRFRDNLPPKYAVAFQVRRAELDEILLRRAAASGVTVHEEATVLEVDLSRENAVRVRVRQGQEERWAEARFVVDASGLGNVVARQYGERVDHSDLRKISFFAHYQGVAPSAAGEDAGNTVIAVLRDGWFWLIPLDETTTSVGLVVDRDDYLRSGLKPEEMLARAIGRAPYVAGRMENAQLCSRVYARKDFSYRMKRMYGSNFVLLGDSAGFIDPIFSTGVFMAMKSAELAVEGVEQILMDGSAAKLRHYERMLGKALARYFEFIANFYRREFLEVFLQPSERFGLMSPVVSVLAGRVFDDANWLKLRMFFSLVKLQGKYSMIAPRIAWDKLPAAAQRAR